MSAPVKLEAFGDVPGEIQAELQSIFQVRKFASGEQIFAQDAPASAMYLVARGRIKITRVTREGFESVLCVRRPGEYFCPVSVMDRGPQLGTATAMGDVTLLHADKEQFASVCKLSPALLSMVQGACIAEVRHLMHRLEAFSFRSVRERLALTLLGESRRQRAKADPPDEIRLTQHDLAGLVGASRESISRALGRLASDGLVESGRGWVRIRDREGLKRVAGETGACSARSQP